MDAEVENEIATWKFRTWLMLTVVFCGGFVPIILWVVVRAASVLTSPSTGPNQSNLATTGLAGLTISILVLALIIARLAICGYRATKDEAQGTVARESAIAYLKGEISVDKTDEGCMQARAMEERTQ